jgi:DNA-binding SARP family transcriptional activator
MFAEFQVMAGATTITSLLRPRARLLLAYLLLHRQRPLPRERIAFTLWPGSSEKAALGTLRRALSELRASLPADATWITDTPAGLRWNTAGPFWLDVEAFERFVGQAAPLSLHDAIALYTGDLLAEWGDEWVLAARERLRQMQFNSLRQLVSHHRALGEIETALALARQALALDPLSEVAYRDLIRLHYDTGDRAAALAEYERLRALLHEELGVEPMAETEVLRVAIIRGVPTPVIRSVASAPTLPRKPVLPRLFGRKAEMDALTSLWESVASGRGQLAIVSGEPGVGKSHLVRSLADHATQQGGLALLGHCHEHEQALPFQAIVEMLRPATHLLRYADLAPAHRATLARLAPDVLGAAGSPPITLASFSAGQGDDTSSPLRPQLFEALLHTFVALARNQPLLMTFEDVHWAGESTLEWLAYVAPRLSTAAASQGRLLVVITYRSHEVEVAPALTRLERHFAIEKVDSELTATRIALRPLSREAHRELVGHLSGLKKERVAPLANRLFAETGGNPFFLHELVRGLAETGQIKVRDGRWAGVLVDAAPDVEISLPDSLRETISARVARLSEMARAFLQVSSVAGRTYAYEIVRHAGSWSDDLALEALESLLARGFIRESEPAGNFDFAHHLVQEAVYTEMTAPRRTYWHRQLAQALQVLRPEEYEALAYHLTRAGEGESARAYYVQAGDRAQQLFALRDAATHYQAALAHWPEADSAGRAETLHKFGMCQYVNFELPSALESLQAARALFESLGQRPKTGDMERMIGRLYWELGQGEAARSHYQRALALLEGGQETVELARALSWISQMHMVTAEFDQAIAYGERALALAERLGAEDVIVHALNNVGSSRAHVHEFDPERGLSNLHDSLRRALALGLVHDACRAYFNLGEDLAGLCRYAEARAVFDELQTYAGRAHAQGFAGGALRRLAALEWTSGHWAAVFTHWDEILSHSQRSWEVWALKLVGRVHNDLGRAETARLELERTLPQALTWGAIQVAVPHLEQLARAYADLGLESKTTETVHHLLKLMDHNPYLDWVCTMPVVFACRWHASHPEAIEAARACIGRLERADRQLHTPETAAALAEGRAAVALAEDWPFAAVDHARRASAAWEALGRPYDSARALTDLGRALAALSDSASALSAFDQALSILNSLAAQADDPEVKHSFLESALVREVRTARAKLAS